MTHKNAARNREIYAAYCQGQTMSDLARQYGLAPATVRQIINSEKHLRAVSVEPVYRVARNDNPERQ